MCVLLSLPQREKENLCLTEAGSRGGVEFAD